MTEQQAFIRLSACVELIKSTADCQIAVDVMAGVFAGLLAQHSTAKEAAAFLRDMANDIEAGDLEPEGEPS